MKQVTNWKQQRREYLRKKRELWLELFLGTVVLLALVGVIAICFSALYTPYKQGKISYSNVIGVMSMSLLLFVPLGGIARWCWRAMQNAAGEMAKIPYVPRAISPSTLTADEILVRGSDAPPVAQSEVLLRATQQQETAKEELLRVSQEIER